jgi:hypothetical protein
MAKNEDDKINMIAQLKMASLKEKKDAFELRI